MQVHMMVAVLGGTGRAGQPLVAELLRRDYKVVVLARDPAKLGTIRDEVKVITGDSRDEAALTELVSGVDAVVSTLGPVRKQGMVNRDTAKALISVMRRAGVRRYIGVTGAGIDVPGDQKAILDKALSKLIQLVSRKAAMDRAAEYEEWAASDLDWTLVRAPRLRDGSPTHAVEHDAHRSAPSPFLRRSDLAEFLVDVLEQGLYIRQAPLVGAKAAPADPVPE
ncbi:MAG TPA: NAD(P)H-binding protein [Propionibacteriaceae bacterium]|nr:NAD(P)H-binding protein [Propionibacteriaceae bacterium]